MRQNIFWSQARYEHVLLLIMWKGSFERCFTFFLAIRDVNFNNAGDHFLSTSYDRYVKLWDAGIIHCILTSGLYSDIAYIFVIKSIQIPVNSVNSNLREGEPICLNHCLLSNLQQLSFSEIPPINITKVVWSNLVRIASFSKLVTL